MNLIFPEIKSTQNFISPSPPPPLRSNSSFDFSSKISPNILMIIIILSIIFFISGLIHILVKFLLTPSSQNRDDYFDNNVTAFQGQLQQLFHLHDSGVDQSLIDTLPVFHYRSIVGFKISPFDCPICLCEFETEDKLRLLPKCSHAFHVNCIDTWLLSHSTCPLCRSNLLLSDFSSHHSLSSSYLLVRESASEQSSRDMIVHIPEANDLGSTRFGSGRKLCDPDGELDGLDEKFVPLQVKLGKFRNIDHVGEGSENKNCIVGNSSNVDERRCFSMGSYEYIMDQEATLKVHVSTKKLSDKDRRFPGHRVVMSECGFDPTVKEIGKSVVETESFSLSKIWLRGKKEKQKGTTSARDHDCSSASSSSIRFPKNGICTDEENQKSENSESLDTKTPSFARRTMIWLAGRQNMVVHPSSTSRV
ncbi:hypothetical protein EUTSA_v10022703mg [Eutrema salsugineum]|uniref:RING-type E3 ubiquitin transferase n=2 Tax=Eutrema salsugineum TaxID=72664 RepID=V4M322_EUTSA|nr:hypothetical protein EUTSA_v10022703mg [Eutrema salsugineum]